LAKTELEKKELKKDVELKEEQLADSNTILKRQNIVIISVSCALIGVLVLLFMLRKTIHERDRINRELNKSTQNLNELNQIKDKLFSIISHDYRGPLTSVKSTLTLFNDGILSADEQKMIIKNVKNEIDHTLNFLDNMLIWANSQFKGIEVNKSTFVVTDIIRSTVHLMLPQAEHKKINIVIGNSEQLNVLADKEMTTLVLRNLLSNGIKFCSEGNTIEVFCSRKNNMAEIHVKDNGPGIDKEKQEQLFRFEKAQSTYGTGNEKGVGLGLPLCKDFAGRNGGTIELLSEPGKGADFYFTLPIA
jgi:signal transduction histidine kinase